MIIHFDILICNLICIYSTSGMLSLNELLCTRYMHSCLFMSYCVTGICIPVSSLANVYSVYAFLFCLTFFYWWAFCFRVLFLPVYGRLSWILVLKFLISTNSSESSQRHVSFISSLAFIYFLVINFWSHWNVSCSLLPSWIRLLLDHVSNVLELFLVQLLQDLYSTAWNTYIYYKKSRALPFCNIFFMKFYLTPVKYRNVCWWSHACYRNAVMLSVESVDYVALTHPCGSP